MARPWNQLAANAVRGADERGRYADGGNLYLQVAKGGSKSWVLNYTRDGISRAMGLGSARVVSLNVARELAAQVREQLARGIDPIDARKAARQAARAARAKLVSFKQCVEEYHAANETRWSNEKHRREWLSTLKRFAFPLIGHLPASAIDSSLVQQVLAPLVAAGKAVTASRLRGRIETVLDYARAAGRRDGDNPADKAIIANMLPLKSEKADVVHQPALPVDKLRVLLPALMQALRKRKSTNARLLELMILTAMRHSAVRLARGAEFDLAAQTWTVPKERMKRLGRDHRIPIGPRALAIVQELRATGNGEFLFGGKKPIGKNGVGKTLNSVLKTIKHDDRVVPHGLSRSGLKDWAHELRDYPTEVIEQALGHRIKSNVERAYRRGDLFERRKLLMLDWENFCNGDGGGATKVVQLRA